MAILNQLSLTGILESLIAGFIILTLPRVIQHVYQGIISARIPVGQLGHWLRRKAILRNIAKLRFNARFENASYRTVFQITEIGHEVVLIWMGVGLAFGLAFLSFIVVIVSILLSDELMETSAVELFQAIRPLIVTLLVLALMGLISVHLKIIQRDYLIRIYLAALKIRMRQEKRRWAAKYGIPYEPKRYRQSD